MDAILWGIAIIVGIILVWSLIVAIIDFPTILFKFLLLVIAFSSLIGGFYFGIKQGGVEGGVLIVVGFGLFLAFGIFHDKYRG